MGGRIAAVRRSLKMRDKIRQNRDCGSETISQEVEREPVMAEARPHIPPGKYDAICYACEYGKSWGGRVDLYVRFRICSSEYRDTSLFMVCRKANGKLSRRSKLWEQWCLAIGRLPHGRERFSKDVFKGKLYKVLVRDTDKRFSNRDKMPEFMQYSVVDTILEAQTGLEGQ